MSQVLSQTVICNYCGEAIESQSDLIVATRALELEIFHTTCFGVCEREHSGGFLDKYVILNGEAGRRKAHLDTLSAIGIILVWIGILVVAPQLRRGVLFEPVEFMEILPYTGIIIVIALFEMRIPFLVHMASRRFRHLPK